MNKIIDELRYIIPSNANQIDNSRYKWNKERCISYDPDIRNAIATAVIINHKSAHHDLQHKNLEHVSEVILDIEDIKVRDIALKCVTVTTTFLVSDNTDETNK